MFKISRPWIVTAVIVCLVGGYTLWDWNRLFPAKPVDEVIPADDATWDDLPPAEPGEDDWPWWRGPTLDGVASPSQTPPIKWSEKENVIWKADVPGRGHGSPCIWGERIFLASADEEAEIQSLLCYDRNSGRKLWQVEIHRGGFMHRHGKNSHASATPACDGQLVFIAFMVKDAIWLTAVDFEGEIAWQTESGTFTSKHGYGASPLLYKSLVIVVGDNGRTGFLAAVHRQTGKVAWRIRRENRASFASPIVAHVAGRDQLLITGPNRVTSYDPNSGKRIWYCDGPTTVAAATIVADDELVFATAGYPRKVFMAIRADGSGDVTDTHVVWKNKKGAAYAPSPLLSDGLLYVLNDGGRLTCVEADSGEIIYKEQLDGGFSSSPVLVGQEIYAVNEDGVTYVFQAGRKFKLLATNDLADGGFATPAICAGRIYLRTLHHLYCIGTPRQK